MSLSILFHFLCAQHVSDINISIIRSLRLFCWITTLVVLFLVRCVLEFRCGWVGVVSVLQAEAQPHRNSNTHRTKNNTTNVVIQQNSRKLLKMDILMSETCWAHKKWKLRCGWVGVVSVLQAEAQPHRNSNTHRTKNNTTNVVIQQNSRKLLMTDILMSETCWAHKKWNKIASDIKLVFYTSTIKRVSGIFKDCIVSPFYTITSFLCFICDHLLVLQYQIYVSLKRTTCHWND